MGEIEIGKELIEEIEGYCKLNDIEVMDEFIHTMLEKGFNIEKYGNVPEMYKPDAEIIEKPVEVIKEVIKTIEVPVEKIVEKVVEVIKEVEVPVEVIKEVIKEIPVDRIVEKEIIKEVPVEKIVIKEVIKKVKVPVEKIVEVEKEIIKEVPVEKIVEKVVVKEIVKEVPVEKIVFKDHYITDQKYVDKESAEMMSKINFLEESLEESLNKPALEIIKEVPVEKIVTVEKEVPVDKIVEKIVTIKDEKGVKKLKDKITQINLENSKKFRTFEKNTDKHKKEIVSLKQKVFDLESAPPKIVEKEVPVEVIREVVKTIEVPKEIVKEVIKEVPVEKIVIQEKPVEVIKEVIPNDKIRYHMMVVDTNNKLYESKIVVKEGDIDNFVNKADAKYHMKSMDTLKDYHIIKKVIIKPYNDSIGGKYDMYGE